MSILRSGDDRLRAIREMPPSPVAPGGGRSDFVDRLTPGLTAAELAEWADLVGAELGLYFPPERVHQLQAGLARRKATLGLLHMESYRLMLDSAPDEWLELAVELTVGETRFFRQPEVFDALLEEMLPEIIERKSMSRDHTLKIWSVGCSTGEEAYSVAMIVDQVVPAPWRWDVEVTGTDLNRSAIWGATRGHYRAQRVTSLDEERRSGYFVPLADGAGLMVGDRLRELTSFRVHNLAGQSWPLAAFDVIVCQNVLLYLLPELRMPVLDRLYQSLAPGGYLIVGPSEIPGEPLAGGVRPVNVAGILAYCRTQEASWSRRPI